MVTHSVLSRSLIRRVMIDYAVLFLLIAVVAGILGFGGIAGTAAIIAKGLFVVSLVLFVVMLLRREKS